MLKEIQYNSREESPFAILFLVSFVCLFLFSEISHAARKPSGNRECAICHISWLEDFKRLDVFTLTPYDPTPVTNSGKQDVASAERMCFSCHDGFVMDSRFLWATDTHNHPVGVEPSEDVTIPTVDGKSIFPLNIDGKVYCGTCHSAHGIDWNAESYPIFLRMKNSRSSLCVACHLNRSTGPKEGNHPVGKFLPEIPENLAQAGSMFGSKGETTCQSCHRVHGAKQKKILVLKNNKSQLCTSCHEDKEAVNSSKHNLRHSAKKARNVRDQTVSEAGTCSACHIPHKAEGPRLWSQKLDIKKNPSSAFCISCHKRNGAGKKKIVGHFSHPVDVPISRVDIVANKEEWQVKGGASKQLLALPLFDKQGKQVDKGGNVGCMTCHDPHYWAANHESSTDKKSFKVEGDGSNSFLRIANNESALCRNCHVEKETVMQSKHDMKLVAPKSKNIGKMTAEQSGTCSACHVPHNGNSEYLWARKSNRDDSGVMPLCVSCHNKDGVADKKAIGEYNHPLQVSMYQLETTTDLPLFNEYGRREKEYGEVDCSTCHNVHQWDPENTSGLSAKNVDEEGDASNSFLRLSAVGDVKLCLNCHKDKKTVIATDHDMAVTAIDAVNAEGQTVSQSGACGQCHSIHNPQSPLNLWAIAPGEGFNPIDTFCRSCHRKNGAGDKKVPEYLEHPERIVPVTDGRLRAEDLIQLQLPVHTEEGVSENVGVITCATCHGVHQWDAAKNQAGDGENIEGDARNSFLRHSNTEYFLCADCHGDESLYRYKFFHWLKSRAN